MERGCGGWNKVVLGSVLGGFIQKFFFFCKCWIWKQCLFHRKYTLRSLFPNWLANIAKMSILIVWSTWLIMNNSKIWYNFNIRQYKVPVQLCNEWMMIYGNVLLWRNSVFTFICFYLDLFVSLLSSYLSMVSKWK